MKKWMEKLLEMTAEDFLKHAEIEEDMLHKLVTDEYMDTENMAWPSISDLVLSGIQSYLDEAGCLDGISFSAYTVYIGDGEYKTMVGMTDDFKIYIDFDIYTDRENYYDFAEDLVSTLNRILSKPVPDTIRLDVQGVVSLEEILGKQVTEEEVIKVQKFLGPGNPNLPAILTKLAYGLIFNNTEE